MHATVTIEPSALWMPGVPSTMIGQLNRNLMSTLRAHGRLVFASDDEVTTFIRTVKSIPDLPVATRSEWIALLTEFRKSRRMMSNASFSQGRPAGCDLRRPWSGGMDRPPRRRGRAQPS